MIKQTFMAVVSLKCTRGLIIETISGFDPTWLDHCRTVFQKTIKHSNETESKAKTDKFKK